jgi:hypothetical protein
MNETREYWSAGVEEEWSDVKPKSRTGDGRGGKFFLAIGGERIL